jgi:Tfp pilus assembly protein PilV
MTDNTMIQFRCHAGTSLIEVIIAMAIFGLIAASLVSMSIGGIDTTMQAGEQTEAEVLAQKGLEAVRAIRDQAWNYMTFNTSTVSTSTGSWYFDGEGTTETIGKYTRTISFENVCRDGSEEITVCPGTYTDVHTKLVTVAVDWTTANNTTSTVERVAYITNWDSQDWTQTDWFGGGGQTTWSDITMYSAQNEYMTTTTAGQISIISGDTIDDPFNIAGDSSNSWTFTTAGNYTYDSSKILATGAVAQLVGSGAVVVSSTSVNPSFDVNADNWAYADWEQPGGTDVTGSHNSSGGNPSGYVDVSIPGKKGSTISGYWEQSFVTTEDDPQVATTTLDWKVFTHSATLLTSFKVHVFVDSTSGDPSMGTEVWSSGEITGTTGWQSVGDIDIASSLTTSGTYYLKVAVRAITSNGQGNPGTKTVGVDNVLLRWEKTLPAAYPTDKPSIYPNTSFSVTGLESWDSFSEVAEKNGGEIHYQLSNNGGSTWQYWSGSAWATAVASTDYNTSSVVNANIPTFTIVNSQIMFKAYLESDSTQLVQLDDVNVGYNGIGSVWNFSDWDVGGGEVTPTGENVSTGGNDGRYAQITVPKGGGDEIGGYWEQPFRTYRDNPSGLALNFDYKVVDFNGTPIVAEIRSYIDTTTGDPVNLVATTTISAEGSWTAHVTSTPSAQITTAGLYYLKIALWIETEPGGGANATGPFVVGYDNVNVELGDGEHPENADLTSSDFDTGAISKIQVFEWDETLPGAPYIAKFQIRTATTQAGLSSAEWSGPEGKDGDTTDYFTTSTGSLIHIDHNDDRWMQYKAFLSGDGDETPIVEELKMNYK